MRCATAGSLPDMYHPISLPDRPARGSGIGAGCGVDRLDIPLDRVGVPAGGEPERIADEMNNARLDDSSGHTLPTAPGSPFSPSQTRKNTSATPRFFRSVSTLSQNLAPSPPVPAHRPSTSLRPSTVTPMAA